MIARRGTDMPVRHCVSIGTPRPILQSLSPSHVALGWGLFLSGCRRGDFRAREGEISALGVRFGPSAVLGQEGPELN